MYTAAGPRTPPSSVNENVTSDRSRHGSKSDTQSYLAPSLCKTVKASLCSGLKRNSWRYLVGRKRPVFTLDGRYVVVCREVRPLCGSCRFVCVSCMYCLLCFIALVECLFLLQRGERPPARAGEAGPGPDVFASGRTRNFSFWSTRQGKCEQSLGKNRRSGCTERPPARIYCLTPNLRPIKSAINTSSCCIFDDAHPTRKIRKLCNGT